MELNAQYKCPKCGAEVSDMAYFCSNCGHSLKPKPENTSVSKQILVYFVSFFLAPFGLGYAFKYLSQAGKKSKMIGIISLLLTLLAICVVIIVAMQYLNQAYSALNIINTGGL